MVGWRNGWREPVAARPSPPRGPRPTPQNPLAPKQNCVARQAGVKVDVGVEGAGHEVVVRARGGLEGDRDVDQRVGALDRKDLVRQAANNLGPGIKVFVDAVPKAKQLFPLGLDAVQESGDGGDAADAGQHPQHGLQGSGLGGGCSSELAASTTPARPGHPVCSHTPPRPPPHSPAPPPP